MALIVGSYFHDLSYFANARDDEFDDDIFDQILDMVQIMKIERAAHSDSTLNTLFPNSQGSLCVMDLSFFASRSLSFCLCIITIERARAWIFPAPNPLHEPRRSIT